MKTFENFLKEYDELVRQAMDFAKGYKVLVEAHFAKLIMERIARHPKFHRNMTADEAGVTKAEMAEIIREAETAAEAEMKSTIEKHARELYRRLGVSGTASRRNWDPFPGMGPLCGRE